eukprot:364036-Chlamydomonas_euryale.AAC.2
MWSVNTCGAVCSTRVGAPGTSHPPTSTSHFFSACDSRCCSTVAVEPLTTSDPMRSAVAATMW